MIELYTDGAAEPNPGRGGIGVVVCEDGKILRTISQGFERSTNNRMEIMAAIFGLESIREHFLVIYSDSNYLVNTMAEGWKRKKNFDLWTRVDGLIENRNIHWVWVKGHDGNPMNELADMLAEEATCASIYEIFKDTGFVERHTGIYAGSPSYRRAGQRTNQKLFMRQKKRRKHSVQALSHG
jgi:ribonuclease HI